LPACPSGEGKLSVDKKFQNGQSKMKSEIRTEVELVLTAFERNFELR
jgi:hypothetical protein